MGELIKSKVEGVLKQYLETEDEIRKLTCENKERYKEIKENYLDYLICVLSERDEWWFCEYVDRNCLDYYHFGKFQYLSFLGYKDKKIPENYANDYDCHFNFIEGFTTDLSTIANNNLMVSIGAPDYDPVTIEHRCNEVNLRNILNELPFRRVQEITLSDYIVAKRNMEKKVDKLSKATFKNFCCGDEIRYVNRSGIQIGQIALIRGKSGFLVNGTKINLNTPKVEKV